LSWLWPDAVLVGGIASAIHAQPRFSRDADHVLPRLREHRSRWQDWKVVQAACQHWATTLFDRVAALEQKRNQKQ